jgi:antitoxin component of RelBE/YafQ-DinJ toxin-antitoxin module
MSQVIYARVPDEVKDAADAFAEEHGMSLTGAVVHLLGSGLSASKEERSFAEVTAELQQLRNQLVHAQSQFEAVNQQMETLQRLVQRTQHPIGSCPHCHQPITGMDLLALGVCSHCKESLTDLLDLANSSSVDATNGGINDKELLMLLATLGALIGVVYITTKGKG